MSCVLDRVLCCSFGGGGVATPWNEGEETVKSLLPVNLFAVLLTVCLGVAMPASAAEEPESAKHDAHAVSDSAAHDADDAHGDADAHAGHHEHTVHGARPRNYFGEGTDFLYVSPALLVWTVAVFFVTSWLLKKLAWEPILATIEDREHRIAESFRQAELARNHSRMLLEQHDEELGRAHDKARELLDSAREQATKESEAVIAKAREEANASQEAAMREIEAAKVEALAELRGSAVSLSSGIASKIVQRELHAEDFRYLTEGNGQ